MVGWPAGFSICFVFNLLGEREEGGKLNPPHNTFFFPCVFQTNPPSLGQRGLRGCCRSPRQFPKWQEAWRSYTALRRCRPNQQPWSPDLLRPAAQSWAVPCQRFRTEMGSRLCRGVMRSRECLGSVSLDLEVLVTSARARRSGALGHTGDRAAAGTLSAWPRPALGRTLGCSCPPWPLQPRCGKCCTNKDKDWEKREREAEKTPNREVVSSLPPKVHQ